MTEERPALYVHPELALEVAQKLKAACPLEFKDKLQDVYGVLTERDLVFYSLGRLDGLNTAEASLRSRLGSPLGKERADE